MNMKILKLAGFTAIVFMFMSIFLASKVSVANWHSTVDRGKMTGAMNAIIYFRHKHHEPPASWLIVANDQPQQVADTDEAVDNLELKARVWESEHYVKEIK